MKIEIFGISLKYFLISIVILIAAYIATLSLLTRTTKFSCDGRYQLKNKSESGNVYLKLAEHRSLLGERVDSLSAEFRKDTYFSITNYIKVDFLGENVHVTELNGKPAAHLSLLSKKLVINTPFGWFDGDCKIIRE